VACHDVRLSGLHAGELAVVLGGGPIGMLVALVARDTGARVLLSEVNEFRLAFARSLGLEALDPTQTDLSKYCLDQSGGSGADVVFEVSGARAVALGMTDLLAIRAPAFGKNDHQDRPSGQHPTGLRRARCQSERHQSPARLPGLSPRLFAREVFAADFSDSQSP